MSLLTSTNEGYHSNRTHLSSSNLKLLLKSAAQFHAEWVLGQTVKVEKDAFSEGTLTHALILEPEKVATDFAIFPGLRKAGTAWEQFKEENKGKLILSAPQMLRCQKLYAAYKAMEVATKLVSGGLPEHTMVGTIMDVAVKSRADYIVPKKYIVDVKTTSHPSDLDIFKHTVVDYGYELSAALYVAIANQVYGGSHAFYWLVLSKHDGQCHVYKASDTTMAVGAGLVNRAIIKYKQCVKTGLWVDEHEPQDFSTASYEVQEV